MVRIGGGSTKFVLSDRWIVYTKSRKQLLHRKYLLYETGCSSIKQFDICNKISVQKNSNTGYYIEQYGCTYCHIE